MQSFPTPAPTRLRVEIPRGRIRVIAEATVETRIELSAINGDAASKAWIANAEVVQNGDEIVVRVRKTGMLLFGLGGAVEAAIHAPVDSAAILATGSGRIETVGRLGEVRATSGSGRISLGDSSEARARTGSGAIEIASSAGSVDAQTGSGRITVGKVGANARLATGSGNTELVGAGGEAHLKTASGNIEIGEGGDSLDVFTASGNVRIGRVDHGRVSAKTLSGRVSVGVAKGVAALLDISVISGRVNSALESSDAPADSERRVELTISTLSGNVELERA